MHGVKNTRAQSRIIGIAGRDIGAGKARPVTVQNGRVDAIGTGARHQSNDRSHDATIFIRQLGVGVVLHIHEPVSLSYDFSDIFILPMIAV